MVQEKEEKDIEDEEGGRRRRRGRGKKGDKIKMSCCWCFYFLKGKLMVYGQGTFGDIGEVGR